MDISNIVIVSAYCINVIINQFAMWIIRKYHESKPLGMQTILTKVTVFLTKVTAWCVTFSIFNFCSSEIFGPFSSTVSSVIVVVTYISAMTFFSTVASSLIIRYCLIYHGPLMASLSEEEVLQSLKVTVVAVTLCATLVEFVYVSTFQDLAYFQINHLGYPKPDSKAELGYPVAIFTNLVLTLIVQVRVERDALKAKDIQTGKIIKVSRWIRKMRKNGYSLPVLRTIIVTSVLVTFFPLYHMFGGLVSLRWNLLVFNIVVSGLLPILFILKHNVMRGVLKRVIMDFFIICVHMPALEYA